MILKEFPQAVSEKIHWQPIVAKYARPDLRRSLWQAANSLVPFFALFYLSLRSLEISFWLTLPLCILTAGFMVRTFIIFHDCGHGSFFKSQKANDFLGVITGIINFTPYYKWKHDHAIHHATAGDLDRRGIGDVYTMTVREYVGSPWWKRLAYRVMRNPLAMFGVGPLAMFALVQRFPNKRMGKRELASVWWTNLAVAAMVLGMVLLFGWKAYLIVQLLVLLIGGSAGIWLFYVQHNFNPPYWEHHETWNFFKAGAEGSSFYKLPAVLQWFSGNIGFHHIHHISSKIPNYNLPVCHKENPVFHVPPITLLASLKCLRLRLYDEVTRRMVGWEALKQVSRHQVRA
jgi:omega-6 fatty acid desaturase (delta-12 desaturase)